MDFRITNGQAFAWPFSYLSFARHLHVPARAFVIGAFGRRKPPLRGAFMSKKQHNLSNRCLILRSQ
jgi:hypothetical protein